MKYKNNDGSVFSKEEFLQKLKTDKEFNEEFGNKGIDQISELIKQIKENPDSRRLQVNAWAVHDLPNMVLPPCHYGFQVYTRELNREERVDLYIKKYGDTGMDYEKYKNTIPTRAISLMWNQRSVDTFLGLPFNIASYGLLLEIIAKEVNMVPEELIGNLGDVHLYSNHIDAAKEQIGRELTLDERKQIAENEGWYERDTFLKSLKNIFNDTAFVFNFFEIQKRTREPFPLPTLKFNPCPITGIDMEYQSIAQFEIENYQSHPTIKAPLSN